MAKQRTKTTIEILQEIQNYRNEQIRAGKMTNIFVTEVQLIGTGENSGKKIYRLLEDIYSEDEKGESQKMTQELFFEYENEPNLVGVRNPQTQGIIVPIGFEGDRRKEWDAEREDIEKCLEEREKQIRAIATEIGISEEEIESLSEIELEHKIVEMGISLNKDEEKQNVEDKEDEAKQVSQKQVQSMGSMNEISLDAPIDTKGNTLGKELGLDEYAKIMVVHSYKLADLTDSQGNKGKRENLKFGFIAQKKDGTYETIPLDMISMYRGENREVTTISDDEEDKQVETKNDEYIFNTPKSNKKLVIRQSDPYGIPEVYLAQTTRDNDGLVGQELQDRFDGTEKTDVEVRKLFNPNKGVDQIDQMKDEAKEHRLAHQDRECNERNIDDVDGDRNTATHIHENSIVQYEGMEANFTTLAKTIGGCEKNIEVQLLLARTNMNLDNNMTVEQAINSAIEERKNEIIQQADEPDKIIELMERASVDNPNYAIAALQQSNGDVDLAVEIYEQQYRNNEEV